MHQHVYGDFLLRANVLEQIDRLEVRVHESDCGGGTLGYRRSLEVVFPIFWR
jgi:hypothetical protein